MVTRFLVAILLLVGLVGCSPASGLDAGEREIVGTWKLVAIVEGSGTERMPSFSEQRVVRFNADHTTDLLGDDARWYRSTDGALALMTGGDAQLGTSLRVNARVDGERLLIGHPDSTQVFVRQ